MRSETTSEAFFEAKYRNSADPWEFARSDYEQARYGAIMGCLQGRFFGTAFEPGCSIGVLTEQLVSKCSYLYASDISATAVARASERCRRLRNVEIRHAGLPQSIPNAAFDLVVFSEIGYYFSRSELTTLANDIAGRIAAGGTLLAVHWLGESPDHILSGDHVHQILESASGMTKTVSQRYSGFRLDEWSKDRP